MLSMDFYRPSKQHADRTQGMFHANTVSMEQPMFQMVPANLQTNLTVAPSKNRADNKHQEAHAYKLQQQQPLPMTMSSQFEQNGIKYFHGTTTLAFIYQGGIVMAVDSRASMGSYIGSNSVKKIVELSPFMLGTIAGGAADCSFWQRNLSRQVRLHKLVEGKRITVAAASKLLGNQIYSYRNHGLSMGIMLGGFDEATGPALYYLDDDGTRLSGQRFSVGSGATYAYGVLDSEYHYDLAKDDAIELGRRAIFHATGRDAYSGGTINVYHIGLEGWKQHYHVDRDDLPYGEYVRPVPVVEKNDRMED